MSLSILSRSSCKAHQNKQAINPKRRLHPISNNVSKLELKPKNWNRIANIFELERGKSNWRGIERTNHVLVGLEPLAQSIGLKMKMANWMNRMKPKNGDRGKKRSAHILVEEVAVDGPVESVFEGSAVEDPNPLLLSCPASYVRGCWHSAHLSLSHTHCVVERPTNKKNKEC